MSGLLFYLQMLEQFSIILFIKIEQFAML